MNPALRQRLLAVSTAGVTVIAATLVTWYEGRRHVPYVDPVGVLTVCEGITGAEVVAGKRYSDAECDALRDKHIARAAAAVQRQVRVPLSDWQRAALIDYTYNLGEGNLAASTMVRRFNAGDIAGGCAELSRWINGRVGGRLVPLPGLIDRRGTERELCEERL